MDNAMTAGARRASIAKVDALTGSTKSAALILIEQACEDLRNIGKRLWVLEAFTAELHRQCKAKKFDVQNEAAWMSMFDMRVVFVLQLGGWAKGAVRSGGMIGKLQANAAGLRAKSLKKEPLPERIKVREKKLRSEALGRVFGDPALSSFNQRAFDKMSKIHEDRTAWLMHERSAVRAHPYEHGPLPDRDLLNTAELRSVYDELCTFVTDLRIIAGSGTYSFTSRLSTAEKRLPRKWSTP